MQQTRPTLVLASASPRRAALLTQLGVCHRVQPADVDETPLAGEPPGTYVERLAQEKCRAVLRRAEAGAVVLAADTVVVLNQKILGKPGSEDEAVAMLCEMSNKTHEVYTGVALGDAEPLDVFSVVTAVEFASVTEEEARIYWRSGEPADKAGAYGIQGVGGMLAKRIHGSYGAVVGLPLAEVVDRLKRYGLHPWQV